VKVIEPEVKIESSLKREEILKAIERAGRTCYKSEERITPESASAFVRGIVKTGHESVIEHQSLTVRFVCDRGVTHEIVRHRLAAYSQESTRYCNYSKGKFGGELSFIRPFFFTGEALAEWEKAMSAVETTYLRLLEMGSSPEQARSILPNSLKTEIVMTANLREWRHFFRMRAAAAAHPQMRQVAIPLLLELKAELPELFGEITYDESVNPDDYAKVTRLS
jgi:thymidylate synthase (FAD)